MSKKKNNKVSKGAALKTAEGPKPKSKTRSSLENVSKKNNKFKSNQNMANSAQKGTGEKVLTTCSQSDQDPGIDHQFLQNQDDTLDVDDILEVDKEVATLFKGISEEGGGEDVITGSSKDVKKNNKGAGFKSHAQRPQIDKVKMFNSQIVDFDDKENELPKPFISSSLLGQPTPQPQLLVPNPNGPNFNSFLSAIDANLLPPGANPKTPEELAHQMEFWQWALYGNASSPGSILPKETSLDYGEPSQLHNGFRILDDGGDEGDGGHFGPPPPSLNPLMMLSKVKPNLGEPGPHRPQWNGPNGGDYYHNQNNHHQLTICPEVPGNHKSKYAGGPALSSSLNSSKSSSSSWYEFQTDLVSGDSRLDFVSRPSFGVGGNQGGNGGNQGGSKSHLIKGRSSLSNFNSNMITPALNNVRGLENGPFRYQANVGPPQTSFFRSNEANLAPRRLQRGDSQNGGSCNLNSNNRLRGPQFALKQQNMSYDWRKY